MAFRAMVVPNRHAAMLSDGSCIYAYWLTVYLLAPKSKGFQLFSLKRIGREYNLSSLASQSNLMSDTSAFPCLLDAR